MRNKFLAVSTLSLAISIIGCGGGNSASEENPEQTIPAATAPTQITHAPGGPQLPAEPPAPPAERKNTPESPLEGVWEVDLSKTLCNGAAINQTFANKVWYTFTGDQVEIYTKYGTNAKFVTAKTVFSGTDGVIKTVILKTFQKEKCSDDNGATFHDCSATSAAVPAGTFITFKSKFTNDGDTVTLDTIGTTDVVSCKYGTAYKSSVVLNYDYDWSN